MLLILAKRLTRPGGSYIEHAVMQHSNDVITESTFYYQINTGFMRGERDCYLPGRLKNVLSCSKILTWISA